MIPGNDIACVWTFLTQEPLACLILSLLNLIISLQPHLS